MASENTLDDNEFNENEESGIHLFLSDDNTIENNEANDNYYGIYLHISDNNVIKGNTFIGNMQGIFEEDCEGNTFENNIVEDDINLTTIITIIIILIVIGVSAPLIIIGLIRYKNKRKERILEEMRKEALESNED